MAEVRRDVVTAGPLDRLAALLDYPATPWPGVPPLGHWLYTLPDARQSALGPDGHPAAGEVAPPAGRPRRMWGGSRVRFRRPLAVGDVIERRSTVVATADKPGMTLLTVRHEVTVAGDVAVVEEQDLVYLPARTAAPPPAPRAVDVPAAEHVRTTVADAAALFRFSALTFNAHRIHYDRDYATGVEHYPGLVVHGPLLATLLIDHVARHRADAIASFAFRARSPVFDGQPFDLCLAGDTAWVRAGGVIALTATVG